MAEESNFVLHFRGIFILYLKFWMLYYCDALRISVQGPLIATTKHAYIFVFYCQCYLHQT